ncbi:MAG: DUF2795 domain-containing protein [Armatimonadota bacterium]
MDWLQKGTGFAQDKINDYTEGLNYPASKDEIVAHAREKNLPKEVIDRLEKLPDKQYNSSGEVISSAVKDML